ncbi:MAG: hypothetical protein GWP03_02575 [Proteobacteria bacterium]|nr:hypothetical protein [Pseudomonadota bacterium]
MDIIKEYWGVLWRFKILLLILIIVPTLVALFINIKSPNIYRSDSNFIISDQSGQLSSGMSSVIKSFMPGGGGTKNVNLYQIVMGEFNSNTMANDVINKFDMMKFYKVKYKRQAIQRLEKNTEIKIDEQTGVINLSFYSREPKLCRDVVQFYLERLNRINDDRQLTTVRKLIKVIDPPKIPSRKTYPKRAKNMVTIFILISIFAIFSILFYYYFYPKIMSFSNLERKTGKDIKLKFNSDYTIDVDRFVESILVTEGSKMVYITSPNKINGKSLLADMIIRKVENRERVCVITNNRKVELHAKEYENIITLNIDDTKNKVDNVFINELKSKFKLILVDGPDFYGDSYSFRWEYFSDNILLVLKYRYNYYNDYFNYIKEIKSDEINTDKLLVAYYSSKNDI